MARPSSEAEKAFLAAYDTYADAVFRFCAYKVSDKETALDITQETFMKVWETYTRGTHVTHWKAFLFKTAHNLVIDHYRRKKSSSLDALEEATGFLPAAEGMSAEDEAELSRAVAHLSALSKEYAEPVRLRFVEGFSPQEIADILGVSPNVVSVRIHRGIAELRKRLSPPSAHHEPR